ncbi:NHR-36 protein, partial [Aphelenchoides avenae]
PEKLEYDVFCRVVEPVARVGLSTEEYVLLKAVIYSLDVPGVSSAAAAILGDESRRYSRILLRHMQRKLGEDVGAKKYAEIVALVDAFMHFAQRFREFYVMVFTFTPGHSEPSEIFRWFIRQ